MPIAFDDEGGFPRMVFEPFRSRATRQGIIAWADISALINDVFPQADVAGIFPQPIEFPDYGWMLATSMSVEPVGERVTGATTPSLTTLPIYEKARITIEYAAPDHDTDLADPVELLSHRWSPGAEFLVLPTSRLTWAEDGALAKDVNAGLLVPTIEHEITWNQILFPPFAAIRTRIGRVNSADIGFVTGNIDGETLLFLGAELSRQIMTDGARAWQVTYMFSERRVAAADQDDPGGWNHFYRNDIDTGGTVTIGFYRLRKVAVAPRTTVNIYETTTFAPLFVQEV